jgi:uncharacterized protein Yka (UPF0111/DUF47 family)
VKLRPWFFPDVPDVLGMLREQSTVSIQCLDALVAWAGGDADAVARLRAAEQHAGSCKKELWRALRIAFSTPLDPEDLYSLSFLLDLVLSGAHNIVRDSEVLGLDPNDAACATMATVCRDAVAALHDAFPLMADDAARATTLADEARHCARRVEHLYREAMPGVLAEDDLRRVWAETLRYGLFVELADRVVRVSDRVWYAVVKES